MYRPLVSVLIPAYNAGAYLRSAVDSILEQSYRNLEILVIDDGSTDGCLTVLDGLTDRRLRILRRPHGGKAAALNFGLEQFTGDFFVIQDADDLSHPLRIQRLVQGFSRNDSVAAVFTGHDVILEGRHYAPRFRSKSVAECKADIAKCRMPALDPTVMFRAFIAREFAFEPALAVGQVWDFILQVGEKFPIVVLGECLYSYRIHAQSNSRRDAERRRSGVKHVLQRAHQRRGLAEDALRKALQSRDGDDSPEFGVITHFIESVLDLRRGGRPILATQTALACARLRPLSAKYYKPLLYSLVPRSAVAAYRSLNRR